MSDPDPVGPGSSRRLDQRVTLTLGEALERGAKTFVVLGVCGKGKAPAGAEVYYNGILTVLQAVA